MPNVHRSIQRLLFAMAVVLFAGAPALANAQESNDLATKAETYRLTEPTLRKFIVATRQLAAAGRRDPDVARYFADSKGAPPAAITRALAESDMSTEEYSLFFAASVYASMAQVALDSDDPALKSSIPSMARLNAAFVRKHQAEYEAMRDDLAVLQGNK